MSETQYFKLIVHTNDGETMTQYAAWREGKAVIFVLGDPASASDGYTASDPNAVPDPDAKRPARVLTVVNVKHAEERALRAAFEGSMNLDYVDEVPRPPIGDVNLGAYTAYGAWFGSMLEV